MEKKRKVPASQRISEEKLKFVREDDDEEETSDEDDEDDLKEESSSEEDSDAESESEGGGGGDDDETSSSEEEENDEGSKRQTVRELLEPFGKDEIVDLLKEAASKDAILLPAIILVADSDPAHRKIFVHGLGWDVTAEQLFQAFKPYGEIEESKLITDKNTGRAKGYAFVLFKSRAAARKALKVPQKKIGSRNVSCQLAAVGQSSGAQVPDLGRWKIFVGNVGPNVNPEKLKAFFRKYGEIEDGHMGIDATTNKFRGFAIITYKSAEGFNKALEEPTKIFENCQLQCKKFVENHIDKNQASNNNAVSDVNYGGLGANLGILPPNLNVAGYLMAQNAGVELGGNAMLSAGYNPAGLMASGLSSPFAAIGGNYGVNSVSPSVMGRYGSQAALHGVVPLQSAQTGHSSVGTTTTAATSTRDPGSALPSYLRH